VASRLSTALRPLKSGYTEFFGPVGGGIDCFTHCDRAGKHNLYQNETEIHRIGYATDLISDEAVAFIERQAQALIRITRLTE
jgi:hypothetical protein